MSARPYAVTAYRDLTPDVQRAVTPLWNLPPRHGTAAQVAEATRTDAAKVSTVQRHHPAWLDAPAADEAQLAALAGFLPRLAEGSPCAR
jgi:hypothetical protein